MKIVLYLILLCLSLNLQANEVKFFGPNAVIPDVVQQDMISLSIEALLRNCSYAKIISNPKIKKINRGVEVNYSTAISIDNQNVGKIANINKVVIRLWDNAEKNYGMDIYAYNDTGIYSFAKYYNLAYPIINMIL